MAKNAKPDTPPAPPAKAEKDAAAPAEPTPPPARVPLRGWRDLWQIPALALGFGLLVMGLMTWVKGAPRPDFESALESVESLIEHQQYTEALELLNGPIVTELNQPEATDLIKARFHALRGDAIYLAQKQAGAEIAPKEAQANNRNVLSEYESAAKLDKPIIDPRRQAFIAEALLDLQRHGEAIERIRGLPDDLAPRRHRLFKRVITELMAGVKPSGHATGGHGADSGHGQPEGSGDQISELLAQLRADPTLPEEDRLWVTARRAERKLLAGFPSAAIDEIIPEIQRLNESDQRIVAELFLLLGRAYMDIGRIEQARANLTRAEDMLGSGDELRGQVDVLLARIAQVLNETEEARDRYATVAERFVGVPSQLLAFVGLGEVEADLNHFPESLAAYEQATRLLSEMRDVPGAMPQDVDLSIAQRYQARAAAGDLETALAYAELIAKAYPAGQSPPLATLRLAEAHLALAEETLRTAGGSGETVDLDMIDPETLDTIRRHFRMAGEQYRQHVQQATVTDPEVAANSLWRAADSFDRAGDQDRAIQLFTEFMQARRQDPRQYEARFRLARAFQSKGSHETAIRLFEQIIAEKSGSDEAYRSYVPLAQSLILSDEKMQEKAEGWLLQVVDGRIFQPSAPQFREALVEMGRLYLKSGRYAESIARFEEALERYPDLEHRTRVQFELADAYRLSATQMEKQLGDAMPLSERTRLEELRVQRLNKALAMYETVRAAVEAQDPRTIAPLDRLIQRNSIFYRGDCAFDLGQFDTAIRYYDAAAQRYASDPASLVAMVQIVNCYASLGKWREASTAHERAQDRLRELPEGVWRDGQAPMDRRHWERWLEASVQIRQMEKRVDAEGAEGP